MDTIKLNNPIKVIAIVFVNDDETTIEKRVLLWMNMIDSYEHALVHAQEDFVAMGLDPKKIRPVMRREIIMDSVEIQLDPPPGVYPYGVDPGLPFDENIAKMAMSQLESLTPEARKDMLEQIEDLMNKTPYKQPNTPPANTPVAPSQDYETEEPAKQPEEILRGIIEKRARRKAAKAPQKKVSRPRKKVEPAKGRPKRQAPKKVSPKKRGTKESK